MKGLRETNRDSNDIWMTNTDSILRKSDVASNYTRKTTWTTEKNTNR